MPAPIRKDSMSRCEEPSMLYDTVRNPAARSAPAKPVDPANQCKDTIETTQQRLNREVLERFQNTSSRLPHHSFVVVAQAGKYLFLAIMLPPYLCFYGIPRWLLMDALPQFFILVKTESIRVGRFFVELSKQVVDIMVGLIDQMIGDALRAANQAGKHLFGYMTRGVRQIIQLGEQLSMSVKNTLTNIQSHVSEIASQLGAWVKNILQKAENYGRKAADTATAVIKTLLHPLDLIDHKLLRPAANWVKEKLSMTSKAIQRTYSHTLNLAKKALKTVFTPLTEAGKMVSAFLLESAKRAYQQTMQQVTSWIKPQLEILDRARDKIQRLIAKVASRTKSKTSDLASSVAESIKNNVQLAFHAFLQIPSYAWWLMAPTLKNQWERFRKGAEQGKKFYKGLRAFATSAALGLAGQGRTFAKFVMKGVSQIGQQLKHLIVWLIKQLLLLPLKLLRLLVILFKSIIDFLRITVYGIRLLIAWTWVISGYGILLLKELAVEVSNWAEFNKSR